MNKDVIEQLGGYQHITTGVVCLGDKVTYLGGAERCISDVVDGDIIEGLPVQFVERDFGMKVYRNLPVARQGDIDHVQDGPRIYMSQTQDPARFDTAEHYIPQDSAERKTAPMFRGLLGYFPAALFEISRHSFVSNEKHNPGEELHWARGKSNDHADCIVRHLIDAGDANTPDRLEHLRALAWRACALLQEECERLGAKPGVNSRHG